MSNELADARIQELKEQGATIIIATLHWGEERSYDFTSEQQDFAHYLIDNGVDFIAGSHSHVIGGLEVYKGKTICYSLGNFSFGGNKNPSDKDTMIVQGHFNILDGELQSVTSEIIPCSVSSEDNYNNFQPNILDGEERIRVYQKILEHSYNYNIKDVNN